MIKDIDLQEIDRFEAIGDDGEEYTIVHYRELLHTPTLDGPSSTMIGREEFFLTDGGRLRIVDDQSFVVVSTGVTLTRL